MLMTRLSSASLRVRWNNDKNIFPREPILMDALGHRKTKGLAVRQPCFLLTFSHTLRSALSSRQCGRRRAYAQSTSVAQCPGSLCKARVNKPMVTASPEELCRELCSGTVDEDEVDLDMGLDDEILEPALHNLSPNHE